MVLLITDDKIFPELSPCCSTASTSSTLTLKLALKYISGPSLVPNTHFYMGFLTFSDRLTSTFSVPTGQVSLGN